MCSDREGGLFWCTPQSYSHLDFGLGQSWILGRREALVLPWEYGQTPGWRANIVIEFRTIYIEARIWPVQGLERVLVSISCRSLSCPVVAPRKAWSKHLLHHNKQTGLWLLSEFHWFFLLLLGCSNKTNISQIMTVLTVRDIALHNIC